eukprot:sb/3466129/
MVTKIIGLISKVTERGCKVLFNPESFDNENAPSATDMSQFTGEVVDTSEGSTSTLAPSPDIPVEPDLVQHTTSQQSLQSDQSFRTVLEGVNQDTAYREEEHRTSSVDVLDLSGSSPVDYLERSLSEEKAALECAEEVGESIMKSILESEETIPIVEETIPIVEETIPIVEETIPIVEETIPIVEETIPIVEETIPIVEETIPIVEETIPLEKETIPLLEEETIPLVEEETVPLVEEECSGDDNISIKEGAALDAICERVATTIVDEVVAEVAAERWNVSGDLTTGEVEQTAGNLAETDNLSVITDNAAATTGNDACDNPTSDCDPDAINSPLPGKSTICLVGEPCGSGTVLCLS